MIALLLSLILSFATGSTDAITATKEGKHKPTTTTTTQPTITTLGGSTTWAEGTH